MCAAQECFLPPFDPWPEPRKNARFQRSRGASPSSSIHRVHTSLSLCKFSRVSFYEERMDGICSTLLEYFLEYILDEWTWTLCPVSESSGSVSLFIRVFSFLFPGNEYLELFQICNFEKFETNIYLMNISLCPVSESNGSVSLFIRRVFSFLFPGISRIISMKYFKYVISKNSKRIYTR